MPLSVLAFLGSLSGMMHEAYSKSELFVIFCSLALALYYLSQIFGWFKKRPGLDGPTSRGTE